MPIKLNGSSSGFTQIDAASVAGNNTLTLPTASGTLMTTGGTNTFTANQVIEVTDNTNAALRITQLGTGAALLVEDSTNPDSTPFVVDASGNVGIGLSSPASRLDIKTTSANSNDIRLSYSSTDYLGFSGQSDGYQIGAIGSAVLRLATGGTERMRIDSSGNVLVGQTSDVAGSLTGIGITGSNRVITAYTTAGASAGAIMHCRRDATGNYIQFQYGAWGTQVGTISTNGSSTAYNTTSDYRLKEDIKAVEKAAQRLLSLKPVNFAWKLSGERVDGFIAHEAQEIVPEAVTGAKDAVDADGNPVYQGIDQSKLVPLLTAALQEALTKIDALETRIATLEAI